MVNALNGSKTYLVGALVVAVAAAYKLDLISAKDWEAISTALVGGLALTIRHALANLSNTNGGGQ